MQRRIHRLDQFAKLFGASDTRFENSESWKKWHANLAKLRHDVMHAGRRDVGFDEAKAAVSAGIEATIYLEEMFPDFAPQLRWGREFANLERVRETGGKLFRLFDA